MRQEAPALDSIDIPFVVLNDDIETVVSRMIKAERSSVVTADENAYRLLDLDAIVYAHRQNPRVQIIDVPISAVVVPLEDIGTEQNILKRMTLRQRVEERLDGVAAPFGLLRVDGPSAIVMPRHEPLLDAYARRSTMLWKCTTHSHFLQINELISPGNRCRYHRSPAVRV